MEAGAGTEVDPPDGITGTYGVRGREDGATVGFGCRIGWYRLGLDPAAVPVALPAGMLSYSGTLRG